MLAHVVLGIGCVIISRLLPVAIVPGANGLLGKIGSSLPEPPPSAAGLVHSTWTFLPRGPERSVDATEQAVGRRRLVERRERDHAPGLRVGVTCGDVLEVASDIRAVLDQHVAAEQDRRDQQLAHGRLCVDLLGDHLTQHERPLGVADQHEPAAVVVLLQVGLERRGHVGRTLGGLSGRRCAGVLPAVPMPASVTCRYIGANTRQYCE